MMINSIKLVILFIYLICGVASSVVNNSNNINAINQDHQQIKIVSGTTTTNLSDECKDDSSLTCNGLRIIRNVFKSFKDTQQPLVIIPGLEIVPIDKQQQQQSNTFDGRSNSISNDDPLSASSSTPYSLYNRLSSYLRNHEIKIKFSDIIDKNDFKDVIMRTLNNIDDNGKGLNEARKKDKGMGAVMMMGLMMAKMMAALGLGGIGALAMKALGVSMMALLLAGIVGVKGLASSGHDDHHVQYVTAEHGHHRKRREILDNDDDADNGDYDVYNSLADIPMPYRGWNQYQQNY